MDGYFEFILKELAYAFSRILSAVETKNLDVIKSIAAQELVAIDNDLKTIKGEN